MRTVYYVHFGPLAEYRRESMERTRALLPQSRIVLIDDSNYREPLAALCRWMGWPEVPLRFDPTHPKGRVLLGDWLRLWFASTDPEAVTLCSDCYLLRPVDGHAHAGAKRDICVTVTGGNCEAFAAALHHDKGAQPRMLLHALRGITAMVPLVRDVDYYHHYDHGTPDEHWQKQWFYRNEYTYTKGGCA